MPLLPLPAVLAASPRRPLAVGETDENGCPICSGGTSFVIGVLLGAVMVFGLQEAFRMKTRSS
jgi:hypothetical protein